MSEQQSNVKVKPPRPPVLSKKPAKPTKPPKPPSGNSVKGKPADSEPNQETDILKAPETAANHLQVDQPDVGSLSSSPLPIPKRGTKTQKKDTASDDDVVGTNAGSNSSNDVELTASNNATSQVTEQIQQENQGSLSRSVSSGSADSLKEKVGTPSSSPKVPVRRPKPPRLGHTEDQNCDTHQVNGERESSSPSSSVSRNSSGRPPTRPKPPPKKVKKQEPVVPSTDSETSVSGPNKLEKEAVNSISGKLSKDSPCGSDSESGFVKDDSSVEKKPPLTSKKPMRPPPPSKRPSQMDKVVPVAVTTEKSKPPPLSKPKVINSAKVGNISNSSPSVEKDANGTKALGSGEQHSVGSKTEEKLDQKLVSGHLTPVRNSSQPLPPPRKKRLSLIGINESMDMQSHGPVAEDSGKSEEILKDQNQKGPSESVSEVKAEKEKPKRPGPPTSVSKRSSNGTMFAVIGKLENAETNGSVSETVKESVAEKSTEESKVISEPVGEIKPRRVAPAKPPPPSLKALKQKSVTRDASPIRKTQKNGVEEGTHSGKSSPQRSPSKRPTAPPPPVPPSKTSNGQSQETPTKTPPKRPAPPLSIIRREKVPETKVEESPVGESGERDSAPGGEDEVSSPPPVNEDPEANEVFRPESSTTESSTGEEAASEDRGDPHSLHSDDDFSSDEFSDDERGDEERQEQEDDADFISTLTKEKKKAYQVAKEIRDSEAVFVDVLKLLAQDFKEFINKASKAQGQPVIEDGLLDQILGGLPHLLTFNEELLKDFRNRVKDWPQNPKIGDIFVKKGPYLKLYTTYIQNFEKLTADLDDACNKYPLFGAAVREFEATPRCQSLQVRHYMLKPVQRIPQYRLLLTDYQKNLQPGSEDEQETITALGIVSEVASHVNNHFKAGDNFEKLLSIQHSLIGQHDIVKPGRTFIKEGVLNKISRKELQQRKLFLLSDVLITTASFPSGLRLKAILPLVGMKVTEPQQKDHENEFNILSVERSFTLCASSPEEKEEWVQAIQKAVDAVIAKRSTFQSEEDAQPTQEEFVLGSQAPLWIPDARVTMCQICTSEFTITWRRHHCRACGKVVCGNCSKNKAKLDYLGKMARICEDCVEKLGVAVKEVDAVVKRRKSHTTPNKPLKYHEVTANELDSTISGYLHYKEKRSWKKMWYVVKDKVLYTYRASEDVAALKTFPLIGFKVEGGENCEIKLTQHKVSLVFKADNPTSAKEWVDAFEEATKL